MNLFYLRSLAYLVYFDLPKVIPLRSCVTQFIKILKEYHPNNVYLKEMNDDIYQEIFIVDYLNDNEDSGLVVYQFMYQQETLVVFRGSEIYKTKNKELAWQDWIDNINTLFTNNTKQEVAAMRYLKQMHHVSMLTLCGHSLGGKLAVYGSLKMDEIAYQKLHQVVAFNAPGISKDFLKVYKTRIQSSVYSQKVILMNNEYDIVSALFYPVVKPLYIQSTVIGDTIENILLAHGLYAYKSIGMYFVKASKASNITNQVHFLFQQFQTRLPQTIPNFLR